LPPVEVDNRTLASYALLLWRRKLMILLIVVVFVAATVAIDMARQKQYESTAVMQLTSQNVSQYSGIIGLQQSDIDTAMAMLQTDAVTSIVAQELGVPAPPVSVTEQGITNVVNVSVVSSDPEFAAKAANAYVNAYIKFTTDHFSQQTAKQETILKAQQATLESQISQIEAQIASNNAASASNTALNTRLGNYSAQLQAVNTSLTQLQLDQTQVPSGAILASEAVPSTKPIAPKPIYDALLAGLLALMLAIGLVVLLDFLDDRIRTKEQLEAAVGNLPFLGEIPLFENWKDQPDNLIIVAARPKSSAAEAYRSLRTSIQFIGFDAERPKVIQITSPAEREGKTTTAVDLAVTMASGGIRVALVSCDLRRPALHPYFNTSNEKGLSSVLAGTEALENVIMTPADFPNLVYIPSGPVPPNPSELLGSKMLPRVFDALRETNDIIIADGPPVLPVTDAVVLAQVVDSVILLTRADRTHSRAIARALELLSNVDAPLAGAILNAVSPKSNGPTYGRFRYGGYAGYGGYSTPSRAPSSSK
jgi:capsular exopolysaccharide synthesis family protein